MNQYFLILSFCLTVFLFSAGTHADTSITPNPDALQNYCSLRQDPKLINLSLYKPENRLAFPNPDGEWGVGICWWMSRFQRALTYSAIFEGGSKHYTDCPLMPFAKLDAAFTNMINDRPTRIACFNNARDFSMAHKKQLIHLMSLWQKRDTYHGHFFKGIGTARMIPSMTRKFIEVIYDRVEKQKLITFAMLQTIGPGTHGWLVINAVKENDGIVLDVVDSNYPDHIIRAKYRYGTDGISFPRDLIEKIETPVSTPGTAPSEPPIYKPMNNGKKPKKSFYRQFVLIPYFGGESVEHLEKSERYCRMLGQL